VDFTKKIQIKQISEQIKSQKQQLLGGKTEDSLLAILNSEGFQPILEACRNYRDRIYSPLKTVMTFIKQVLSPDKSCKKAVVGVAVERLSTKKEKISTSTGPYCKARKRLPEKTVKELVKEVGTLPSKDVASNWKVYGRELKVFDGTTVKMPDTKENQKIFPQHKNQKKGAGFPLARVIAVMSLTVGTVIDYAIDAYKGKGTGEISLLRSIIDCIKEEDIVLGDRYFPNYFLMSDLKTIGADGIFQGQSQRHYDFRKGIHLGKKDHVVCWKKPKKPEWMTQEKYDLYPEEISVREFKVSGKIYVTTFLDEKKYPKRELAKIYERRWEIEINLRSLKTIMDMDMLSCKTPEMVRKEIGIHFLAYNFIRVIMARGCFEHNSYPWKISFKGTVQLLDEFMPHLGSLNTKENQAMYSEMLKLITSNKVGNRPGRVEPRAIKQRPKPFPTLNRSRSIEKDRLKRKMEKRISRYIAA
jgi:hypothetical protein